MQVVAIIALGNARDLERHGGAVRGQKTQTFTAGTVDLLAHLLAQSLVSP